MKKVKSVLFILFLTVAVISGCKGGKEAVNQSAMPKQGEEIAVIETSMGTIKTRLFPECAPKAVENFSTHAKENYYDNIIFHRVINDFVIQAGDPGRKAGEPYDTSFGGGESIWGEPFGIEPVKELSHICGALAMAQISPDFPSIGSQFYIVQNKGGTSFLDTKYTVFGQVFEGFDVVDAIAAVQTDDNDQPVDDVVIISIRIEKY